MIALAKVRYRANRVIAALCVPPMAYLRFVAGGGRRSPGGRHSRPDRELQLRVLAVYGPAGDVTPAAARDPASGSLPGRCGEMIVAIAGKRI